MRGPDRAEGGLPGRAVVRVQLVGPPGVNGDDHMGPVLPDDVAQLAQLHRVFEQPVGPAEEDDLLDAEVSRGARCSPAACGQPTGPEVRVVAALVAAGQQHVGDVLRLAPI